MCVYDPLSHAGAGNMEIELPHRVQHCTEYGGPFRFEHLNRGLRRLKPFAHPCRHYTARFATSENRNQNRQQS